MLSNEVVLHAMNAGLRSQRETSPMRRRVLIDDLLTYTRAALEHHISSIEDALIGVEMPKGMLQVIQDGKSNSEYEASQAETIAGNGNYANEMAERNKAAGLPASFPTEEEGAKYAAEHPEEVAKTRAIIAAANERNVAQLEAIGVAAAMAAHADMAGYMRGYKEAERIERETTGRQYTDGFAAGVKQAEMAFAASLEQRDIGAESGRTSPGTVADFDIGLKGEAPAANQPYSTHVAYTSQGPISQAMYDEMMRKSAAEGGATPDQGRVTNDLSDVSPNDYVTCRCGKDFGELGKAKPVNRYVDKDNLAYCGDCKPRDAIVMDVGLYQRDGQAVYRIRQPEPGENASAAEVGHFIDALMRLARPGGKTVNLRDVGGGFMESGFHLAYPLTADEVTTRAAQIKVCQEHNQACITEAIQTAVNESDARSRAHFKTRIDNLVIVLRAAKMAAEHGLPDTRVANALGEAIEGKSATEADALLAQLEAKATSVGERSALQRVLSALLQQGPSGFQTSPNSYEGGRQAGVDKCIHVVQQLLDKAWNKPS